MEWIAALIRIVQAFFGPPPTPVKTISSIPDYGDRSDVVKIYQQALKDKGFSPGSIDGSFGRKTRKATTAFQLSVKLPGSGKPGPKTIEALGLFVVKAEVPPPSGEGMTPYEWVRGELGQKEIYGSKDNPRIRWYHTASGNIGHKEYPDETPWCSSILNKAADECGYEKTDNALASSWRKYYPHNNDVVLRGQVVTLDGHVTLADKNFNRRTDKYFYGLGGNQGNMVKVSKYRTNRIKAVGIWKKKRGSTKPGGGKMKSIFPKQEWTDFVYEIVKEKKLADIPLKDAKRFCSKSGRGLSAENWVNLIAAVAKRESGMDPKQEYKENFKGSNGRYIVSTGLMQISLSSSRQAAYGNRDFIKTQGDLHDPLKNLRASINIMEVWARRDGVISEKRNGKWYGAIARYWSVGRDSLPKTLAVLKPTCRE